MRDGYDTLIRGMAAALPAPVLYGTQAVRVQWDSNYNPWAGQAELDNVPTVYGGTAQPQMPRQAGAPFPVRVTVRPTKTAGGADAETVIEGDCVLVTLPIGVLQV